MEFESFFNKILNFYEVKSVTDLAEKLNVTRSTVSGWKNRQASGAILEYLFNNDLKALHFIFGNEKINNFQNSNINKAFDLSSNSHSQDSTNIVNNPICEQISNMNQTIVSSFINVYHKLEKKGDLKRLHQILGEIEFE